MSEAIVAGARTNEGAGLRSAVARFARPDGRLLISAILVILFGVAVIPPALILVRQSLGTVAIDGSIEGFTFANYAAVISQDRLGTAFLNTLVFAAGSTLLALLLGGSQAWMVERTNTPFAALAYGGAVISLAVPYVLYTVAWLLLLGKAGPLNQWILPAIFGPGVTFNVYSLLGMILVEGFLWSPLAFLILSPVFAHMDPALEEAAHMSGAGVGQVLRRITLPLALPAVIATSLLVFIRSFEAFEIPGLVGLPGNVSVLTTRIFLNVDAESPPDYGSASAIAVILVGLVVGLLLVYGRLTRRAEQFATVTGRGYRATRMNLGRWRYLTAAALTVNFTLVILLPFAILVWASVLPFYELPNASTFSRFTAANFERVFAFPDYRAWALNTLVAAGFTAIAVTVTTAVAGWLSVRNQPGGRLLDLLTSFPLVFPGIVLGLAVLSIFLMVPVGVYGTLWILVIAYFIRFLPYGMRSGHAGALQIHRELEEAGMTSGGSVLRVLQRITLPLMRPAMLACAIFVFLMAARDLAMSVLLASPRSSVVAVAIYDLWSNGQATELAAFGIVWSVFMGIIATTLYALGRRYGLSAVRVQTRA